MKKLRFFPQRYRRKFHVDGTLVVLTRTDEIIFSVDHDTPHVITSSFTLNGVTMTQEFRYGTNGKELRNQRFRQFGQADAETLVRGLNNLLAG